MIVYQLFVGRKYYPLGGALDMAGQDTYFGPLLSRAEKMAAEDECDWWHIVEVSSEQTPARDSVGMRSIREWKTDVYK